MVDEKNEVEISSSEDDTPEVTYNPDKDFYRGMAGELRYKAEGLFKKAKEKGISIEEINVTVLKENQVDFPGIGDVALPAFLVKVAGRNIFSNQVMADGKQIDYYNRYQKYVSDKIEGKNLLKDERGKVVRQDGKPKRKEEADLTLTDWEKFEIGKNLVGDKEFGLEKTITGACDRVIRKLMGENDWLYPEEARLLDEEFSNVQQSIMKEREERKQTPPVQAKKATERQIGYLKAKIKNFGVDPESDSVMREILKQAGFEAMDVKDLSTGDMSRVIDSVGNILPRVKEILTGGAGMSSH